MSVADRLAKVQVLDMTTNGLVTLGDLWASQTIVLCLFRRWGCSICKMGAGNLSALKPYCDKKNVVLVGIGVEKLGVEEWLLEGYFKGPIFIDEPHAAYKAVSAKEVSWRNLWGIFDGAISKLGSLAGKKGYKNNFKGNTNQLGGTYVLAPGGNCLYAHVQTSSDFEPDLKKIAEVLQLELPPDYDFCPMWK